MLLLDFELSKKQDASTRSSISGKYQIGDGTT